MNESRTEISRGLGGGGEISKGGGRGGCLVSYTRPMVLTKLRRRSLIRRVIILPALSSWRAASRRGITKKTEEEGEEEGNFIQDSIRSHSEVRRLF